jgi:5-methylcytosine-specific restriction endonuclease McrA
MAQRLDRKRMRKRQRRINGQLRKRILGDKEFSNCCYCHKTFPSKELTIEHKVPICLGGTSDIDNIDIACAPCNQSRGREAWLIYLSERKRKDLSEKSGLIVKNKVQK